MPAGATRMRRSRRRQAWQPGIAAMRFAVAAALASRARSSSVLPLLVSPNEQPSTWPYSFGL
eukprot:9379095-Lingulodinium_polyedra.AAC.1